MKAGHSLFFAVTLSVSFTAHAATIDWKASGTDSTWATGTNWSTDPIAPVSDLTTDIARFNQTSYAFEPDAGTTSIAGIEIGDGSTITAPLTLSGTLLTTGASGITMFAGAGATEITSAIKLGASQVWTNNSDNDLKFSGAISGAVNTHTVTKNGTGKIILSNTNTWGGSTTAGGGLILNAGSVEFTTDANLGNVNNDITFGGGTLHYANTSADWDPAATRTLIVGSSTGTLNVADSARTVIIGDSNQITAGTTGTLVKAGAGRLSITNAQAGLDGVLRVDAGTLRVSGNASALGDATNRATLNMNGGELLIQDNSARAFLNHLAVNAPTTITVDRTSGGAAVTHTMSGGATTLNGFDLDLVKGANVTSGNAALTLGATTFNADQLVDVGAGTQLTLGAITGGAFKLTKQGAGVLALSAVPVAIANLTINEGTMDLNASVGTYGGILNTAAGSEFEFNGGSFSNASAITNHGTLDATSASYNVTLSGDYTGGSASRIDVRNTAGNIDANVVATEFLVNNGDAYDTGTGVNVLNNIRYLQGTGNITVAGPDTSVYLSGELRFVPSNGQPWIVVRDGGKFVFGSTYTALWEQAGNNRATRIGGNGTSNIVDFQADAGKFLGNGTSGAQIGLLTLITRAATNTFNSGAAFAFYRDNTIWQIRDNSQTFNGGSITFGDLFASTAGRLVDVDVDNGLTMNFGTSTPVFQANTRFRKTVNTGTINFNSLVSWPTQGAQIDLLDGRIQNVTVAANNVLSADWDSVTNAPARGTNGVNFAPGAVVAHQNNTATTMGGLGTAAEVFFGLGTDYSQNVTLGTGTAWSGMCTDSVADRRYAAGAITLNSDVTLQGINGKVLIIGDGSANSAAPTFAGGYGLTINGTVRFDDPDLSLAGVSGITFNAGANLQLTSSVGGDITLFYGNLTALGAAPASALTMGQLKFKGADNLLLTEQAGGSVSLTTTALARIGKGTLVVQPSTTGVLGATNKLLDSSKVANVSLVSPFVIRTASQSDETADFLKYDLSGTTGYVTTTYSGASIDTAANTDSYATAGEAMAVGSAAVRALKVGGSITQTAATATTLTIGGAGDAEAGIIGNVTATIGADGTDASALAFGSREAVVFTKTGTALTVGSTTATTGTGGLTKFGAGTLTLAGINAGLSGTITVNQGILGLNSAPAAGSGFTLGPNTTLNLKSDVDLAFGNLGFDNVSGSTINVGIDRITASPTDMTLSFTGTTTVGAGQTLNINSANSYNLGVTDFSLVGNAKVNIVATSDGSALIVGGAYSDTTSSVVQTQRNPSGQNSGLVLKGTGSATVNATITSNGDAGTNQLTAIGRGVTFKGSIPHGNSAKSLGVYDGGSITITPSATLDTYDGNNWRRLSIAGDGLVGSGATVIIDAAFDTLTTGDLGAITIGNLAILETRNTNNFNNNVVPRGQNTAFGSADGGNGMIVQGEWLVTTASQSYVGAVTINNIGDGNVTASNGIIKTDTDLTLTDTAVGFRVNSGKVFEKLGTGSLTVAKLDATGAATMLLKKGAFRISEATGDADLTAFLANDAAAELDANGFALTVGSLDGGGAAGGNVKLGAGSLVIGGSLLATYAGVISGSASGSTVVTKSGAGIQVFAGANTYSGDTLVTGGTLALSGGGTLGSITAGLTVNGATAILDLDTGSQTVGAVALKNGGQITNGTLVGSSFAVESGSVSASLSGAGGLTKTTAGTVSLSGVNTYTGATTVSEGTLDIPSGRATSPITVSSGAFLKFTLASTIASSSSIELVSGARIKIDGSPSAPSYTLAIADGGITGTPVLDVEIPGYQLVVEGTSLKLKQIGYSEWMAGLVAGGYPGDQTPVGDSDHDGMKNLMEYVLNGQPGSSDLAILPDLTLTPTDVVFTFTRRAESAFDTTQVFEYGSTLAGWTPLNITSPTAGEVAIGAPNGGIPNLQTITITIPRTGDALFGRLVITQP